jgi:hypothetical protein
LTDAAAEISNPLGDANEIKKLAENNTAMAKLGQALGRRRE